MMRSFRSVMLKFVTNRTVTINVCAVPPDPISERIIALAANLERTDLLFRVDGTTRLPHLTILMSVSTSDRVESYIRSIQELALHGPVPCTANGLRISSNSYVEISYNRSSSLERFQDTVATKAASKIRTVPIGGDESLLTPEELLNERRHGYKLYGDLYRPHVTLGAYAYAARVVQLPLLPNFMDFDFMVKELVIGISDEYGALVEVLDRVAL